MTHAEENFNPFRPPQSQSPDVDTLADDAEFLFSSSQILCREEVELPPVCIHLADTENLVRRQKTLRVMSGVGSVSLILLIGLFAFLPFQFGWSSLLVIAIASAIIMAIYRFTLKASLPGMVQVNATWYVSERYLNRVKWQERIVRIIIMGIAAYFGWTMAMTFDPSSDRVVTILMSLVVGGLISFAIRMEQKLTLRGRRMLGRHRGLMVLSGHSRHFAEVADRINSGY